MSSNTRKKEAIRKPIEHPLTIPELGKLLVKHYGLVEGKYDVLVEFGIGTGAVGPTPETRVPGAMIGVNKIGLIPTKTVSPLTIDAAKLNTES
jgi:hypothetical protein